MEKDRVGIAIGVISRGLVSIKWMMHMRNLHRFFPPGMFWNYIVVEGKSYADGRNEVIERARRDNYKYVLFIDDDVFLPDNAVTQLLSRQKDIVTGVYWTKASPSVPVIFRKMGEGPYFDFPVDDVFTIESGGIGATLINMKVFDAFEDAGIPFFKENWNEVLDNGQTMHCNVGEDHWFYHNARKLGFEVYADSNVLCEHYDANTDSFYPDEKIVREYSNKALAKIGREDLIEHSNKLRGLDSDKQTIVFLNPNKITVCGDDLLRKPMGGVESSLIQLSKALYNTGKYNVHVFSHCYNPGSYDGVVYHELENADKALETIEPDVLVVNRSTKLIARSNLRVQFKAKKLYLWAHDNVDSSSYSNIFDAFEKVDGVMCVSNTLKESLKKEFGLSEDKLFVVPLGVDLDIKPNVEKKPFNMIYASTPYRGLKYLPKIFTEVKKLHSEATLDVFSSMKIYDKSLNDNDYNDVFKELESLDGVTVHKPVLQRELAGYLARADVMVYPNTFFETSCLAAQQSVAYGTPVVSTNLGALKETIGDNSILLSPLKDCENEDVFVDNFIITLDALFSYREKINDLLKKKSVSWKDSAQWFEHYAFKNNDSESFNSKDYWDSLFSYEDKNQLGRLNTTFLEEIKQHINANDLVYDFGCGTGVILNELKDTNAVLFGSDISESAIELAKSNYKDITFSCGGGVPSEFKNKKFDVVLSSHVLEHVVNIKEQLVELGELVKEDGKLIVIMPTNDMPWKEHYAIWHPNIIKRLLLETFSNSSVVYEKRVLKPVRHNNGVFFEEYMIVLQLNNGEEND